MKHSDNKHQNKSHSPATSGDRDVLKKFPLNPFKDAFKSEESRFRVKIGFKVMGIPLTASVFISFMFWVFMRINNIFFESNGFSGVKELREAYFDYILGEVSELFPFIGAYFIVLFFLGTYLGGILLRPFMAIGDYCEDILKNEKAIYDPDIFSDLKILTRFSEDFFFYLDQSKLRGALEGKKGIPKYFTRIHGPVFEPVFFFHFCLFLSIICIISSVLLFILASSIHGQIVQLAINTLRAQGTGMGHYLQQQTDVLESVVWWTVFVLVSLYSWLATTLYGSVSGAAFGFFSTMRSFMKGDVKARVHLIGHSYIRRYGRCLNKYLDFMQRHYPSKESPYDSSHESEDEELHVKSS